MKAGILSVGMIGCALASAAAEDHPLPGGWRLKSYTASNLYRIGLDREIKHGGKSAGFLASQDADYEQNHYASLEQSLDATKYRGKRLRLSAFLKSKNVKKRGMLEVEVPDPYADLSDTFRQEPSCVGTSDWKRYEIEFPVMAYAQVIEIRVHLHGAGQIWLDDLRLEVLGNSDDPRTAKLPAPDPSLFDDLVNTDFEQTQLEYDLSVMQGLWENKSPAGIRITRLVEGNKETDTRYDQNGNIVEQFSFDFALERSGRISLKILKNGQITQGLSKGQRWPKDWSESCPYRVNPRRFVEVLHMMDGDRAPPELRQWNRVAK